MRRSGQPLPGERGQTRNSAWAHFLQEFGLPNPDKLDVATYRKMELDPQVRDGLLLRELAIIGKPGRFNFKPRIADDRAEAQLGQRMVNLLTWVWDNLQPSPTVVLRDLLSARRFGFAVVEKIWASAYGPNGQPTLRLAEHPDFDGFLYIERLKLLPPESLEKNGLLEDEFGRLRAVIQNFNAATGARREPIPRDIVYTPAPLTRRWYPVEFRGDDLSRLIVYRANYEEGNPYGQSDHKPAYNAWYAKQATHAYRNMLLERLSGTVVGEAEAGQLAELKKALGDIGPGAVLAVPRDSKVTILQGWEGAVRGFQEAIEYDDSQILRAYLVPNLTAGGGVSDTGSFARAQSDFETFLLVCRQIQLELEEVIEEGFVKPLIDANFGPQPVYPTFDFPPLQEKDRTKLASVWAQAIKDGYVDPTIDGDWLREEIGAPPAPEGYRFQRPEPPAPFGGAPGDAAKREELAAKLAEKPTRFEGVESRAQNHLAVRNLEAKARASVGDAFEAQRRGLLASAPRSSAPGELARIRIPDAYLQGALDALADEVLRGVADDMARKWRALGRPDLATAAEALQPRLAAKSLLGRVLAAQHTEPEPLRAYRAWARALNELESQRSAAELQNRLRVRALQGFETGMTPDEVARSLENEFTTYTLQQLETVSRTTVLDFYNSARNATIDAAGDAIAGLRFVPLLDDATTTFCRDIAGRSIARTDPNYERLRNPPYWYNCRTTVVPILATELWTFDRDWATWLDAHRGVQGGGFVYGVT